MADGSIRVVTKLDNTALKQQIREFEKELSGIQKEKAKTEAAISKTNDKYKEEREVDAQFPAEFSHREDIDKRAAKELDPLIAKQNELNQKEQLYIQKIEAANAKLAEQASIADASKQVDREVKAESPLAKIKNQEEYNSLLEQTRAKLRAIEAAASKVSAQTGVAKNEILAANPAYQKLSDTMSALSAKSSEFGNKAKKAGNDATSGLKKAKKEANGFGDAISKGIKKLGKMTLAVFGIRAAYGAVRMAMTEYMSTHKELEAKISTMKSYFAELLGPAIEFIINLFWQAVTAVNSFIYALTGINFAAKANASALKKQADATSNAAKATAQLAGFDEQNKLSQASSGGGKSSSGVAILPTPDTNGIKKAIDKVKGWVKKFASYIEKLFAPSISAWGSAFDALKEPLGDTFGSIGESAAGLWEETLLPFSQYLLEDFIAPIHSAFSETFAPIFTDTMKVALEEYALDFEYRCQAVNASINDILIPALELAKTINEDVCWSIEAVWDNMGQSLLDKSQAFKESLRTLLESLYVSILKPLWDVIVEALEELWNEHLKSLWENIVSFAAKLGECIMTIWNNFLGPILDYIVNILGPGIVDIIKHIIGIVTSVVGIISDVVGGILKALGGLLDFITGVFSLNWEKAWEGIKDFFAGIWDAIWGIVKGIINLIIGALNTLWSGVYTVVAGIVNTLGDLADTIGSLFGQDWHFSMPKKPPTIPKLAKGGIVNNPGKGVHAILGEAGKEAVLPLENNTEWMDILADKIGGNVTIPIYMDGKKIATYVVDIQKKKAFAMNGA